MFLHLNLSKFNNHTIHPEWRLSSDYTPLTVDIATNKELIHTKKYTIVKNSEEENKFITELIESIKGLNMENISSKEVLEQVVQEFANKMNSIWFKNLKIINITKHLKLWWNEKYQKELEKYRLLKILED